jgi:SAM-dependent methyltransferase
VSAAALTLVVPVFNEQARIPEYAPELIEFLDRLPAGSELVFVDDGSTDGSVSLLEAIITKHAGPGRSARVLRRAHEGKGAAVAAGIRAARSEYAGFCDLDLSTPLDDLDRIFRAATRADLLATGSRDLASSTLVRRESRTREFLGRAYNRLLQATVAPGIVDTQCGAKVARRALWHEILPHCTERGYAWDAEVIAVALALGKTVQEVPIAWRHDDRSKVHVLRDGAAMVVATRRILRTATSARAARPPAAGEVFDDANAEILMQSDRHWWFRSKAAFVATALRRTASTPPTGFLVDVGAGSGGVTAMLGWDPAHIVIVEGNEVLVANAHRRYGLHGVRATVDHLPVADGRADVVCFLDVLEHLRDPSHALDEAMRALRPGGRVVINVPAHEWLWSDADVFLGHVRRYTRPALRKLVANAGFSPRILTHVFSWLVVPVWLTRRARGRKGPELGLDRTSRLIDGAAGALTLIERTLVGRVSVPFGTSLLCVAEKPATEVAGDAG